MSHTHLAHHELESVVIVVIIIVIIINININIILIKADACRHERQGWCCEVQV